MIVASPGIIMVAITSMKSASLPLKSRKEKENAAREQDMICPRVISPATIKELATNRAKGTLIRACRKFSRVGDEGSRFICVVNSSLEGMNATLTAYRSGSSTNRATSTLSPIRTAVLPLFTNSALRLAASWARLISSRFISPVLLITSVCSINS